MCQDGCLVFLSANQIDLHVQIIVFSWCTIHKCDYKKSIVNMTRLVHVQLLLYTMWLWAVPPLWQKRRSEQAHAASQYCAHRSAVIKNHVTDHHTVLLCCVQMGQALWRLPPRQQQQLQEELADRLADQEAGQEQGNLHLCCINVTEKCACFWFISCLLPVILQMNI